MTNRLLLKRSIFSTVLLILAMAIGTALAEEINATPTTETARPIYGGQCQDGALTPGSGAHTSLGAAKTAAEGACTAAGKWTMPEWPWTLVSAPTERWYKQYKYGTYLYEAKAERTHYACAGTNNSVSVNTPCTTYSCPASGGWNLVGNKCTRAECAPGDFRAADGTCKKDCSSKNGQPTPNPRYEGNGGSPTNIDLGGCQARCTVNVLMNDGWAGESCTYTGRPADSGSSAGAASDPPPRDEPDSPADCGGQGMGYVRSSTGKITCVPQSESPPENQPTTTTEKSGSTTGTPPSSGTGSGSGTSGTSGTGGAPGTPGGPAGSVTETTTCKGPNCSTTTTTSQQPDTVTNGTGNGGCPQGWTLVNGKCESTVVTEQPTTDYCQRNPLAPQCKGLTDECAAHPERVSCMSVGNTTETPDPTPRGMTMGNIIALNMGGNNSCPSDVPLPAGAVFSYQKICEGLEMVRPIIIALAWLSAAFIVFGHKKES